MKSLAEVAHDAYYLEIYEDTPSFEDSENRTKLAWDAVARAVFAAHERYERARRDENANRAADADARRFGVQG